MFCAGGLSLGLICNGLRDTGEDGEHLRSVGRDARPAACSALNSPGLRLTAEHALTDQRQLRVALVGLERRVDQRHLVLDDLKEVS